MRQLPHSVGLEVPVRQCRLVRRLHRRRIEVKHRSQCALDVDERDLEFSADDVPLERQEEQQRLVRLALAVGAVDVEVREGS